MPPSDSIADVPAALRAAGTPTVLRKLQRLRIVARHRHGVRPGNTPMPQGSQAAGLELANHKSYAPGDDLRYFDWNAYGRLEQMMVKTFRAEREAPLHLLIDVSASMGVPRSDAKLAFAAALAAGLAYVSLRQHDPVRVFLLGSPTRSAPLSPLFRHPQRLPELQAFLSTLEAHGSTALAEGVDSYLRTTRMPGTAVLLSDFLVPDDVYQRGLGMLSERGYGVAALRVIGPEELRPSLPARVRLHDSETGAERIIDLHDAHRRRYEAAIDDHLLRLKRWCEARSILFTALDTASGIERSLFEDLPRAGLLQ
jgi:uncharacterized protein (DUF58 family)